MKISVLTINVVHTAGAGGAVLVDERRAMQAAQSELKGSTDASVEFRAAKRLEDVLVTRLFVDGNVF